MRVILDYASELQRRGHDVTVYVQSANTIRRTIANTLNIGTPTWVPGFSARVRRVPSMTQEYVKPADVLIASTWQTAKALAAFSESYGKQYYLLQHDEGLYHGPRSEVDKAYALPQRKIVVSTWLQTILRERYAISSELLLNPTNSKLFFPTPARKREGEVRVLLLDHTYPWKGTAEGVEIVRLTKQKNTNLRLVMFGARSQESSFPCDEYHYCPAQEKLAALYSNADIFLCPSWDEGFGLPSFEAMQCGTCVVTYDNGGSRDFAFDRKTALIARNRDKNDLLTQLETAVFDKVLREQVTLGALRFVEDWPPISSQTILLEKILQ